MGEAARILILGIGNILWADEGWGVRAVEEFHRRFVLPENVRLMDGGTQGLYLVQHVCEADVLIVFDAVDYGLPAGTMKIVEDDEVPRFLGAKKMSLHQTGFQEVIMTAELLGHKPSRMVLIGMQPVELEDFGGSLRDGTKARISAAIDVAIAELMRAGIAVEKRAVPLPESEGLAGGEIALSIYEGERPDDASACRSADERFISPRRLAEA
jgi:hydrogenase maturation protease